MFCILTPFQCTFFGTFAVFATLIDHHIARNSGEGLGSFITAKLKAILFSFSLLTNERPTPVVQKMDFSCLVYWSKLTLFATTCIMQMEISVTETIKMYNINHHFSTLTCHLSAFQLDQLPWSLLLMCLKYFASIELYSQFFNWSLFHNWFMLWIISNIFNN